MKKNKYIKKWIGIENWVYSVIRLEQLFLYNTQSGQYIVSKEKKHISIVLSMHEKKNLGFILFEDEWVNDTNILHFIDEAIEKNIFSLEDYQEEKMKPIRLMPVLNIQKDAERLKFDSDRSIGESSLSYLKELSLYVNSKCPLDCKHCNLSRKQFLCCCKDKNIPTLDISILTKIVSQIKYTSISKINILGGDIFSYIFLDKIPEILNDKMDVTHFWSHYKNFRVSDLPITWDIIVDFPIDEQILSKCISENMMKPSRYHFIVQNEEEINLVEKMINRFNIQNFEMHPYYNGKNIIFFKTCIFLNQEDILENTITQRRIFCNQALNSNFFGHLTILPNGDVAANINSSILGNIVTTPLLELITKELEQNTAWRKTRKEKPCSDCLHQYLCPPISNYEMIFGKQNLCMLY